MRASVSEPQRVMMKNEHIACGDTAAEGRKHPELIKLFFFFSSV